MMLRRVLVLLIVLSSGCASAPPPRVQAAPRVDRPRDAHVILVSFDGFRADYLDRYELPAFSRVMQKGARARALIPVFPSKTFPNHYTIVTGLYAEHHGIVANAFWDPQRRETYALGDQNAVTDGTWYRGEPIWVTAEKQGVKAACFFWPGSEAAIAGVRPSYWKTYDGKVANFDRVDGVIEWLKLPADQRPRMITLYFSDVDSASHENAPLSDGTRAALTAVDAALGRLLDGIETLPIRDDIYVVLVSDHGMTETGREYVTVLSSVIDTRDMRIADAGPTANIHVSGELARAVHVRDELNAKLKHGRAYLRADVPQRLHYSADPRIGDVVVIMDEHYMVATRERTGGRSPAGMHGWDPALPSMHGIFLVAGPEIRPGATVEPLESVDIYPFLAELLRLTPANHINGRPGRIWQIVSQPEPAAPRLSLVP